MARIDSAGVLCDKSGKYISFCLHRPAQELIALHGICDLARYAYNHLRVSFPCRHHLSHLFSLPNGLHRIPPGLQSLAVLTQFVYVHRFRRPGVENVPNPTGLLKYHPLGISIDVFPGETKLKMSPAKTKAL